MNAFHDVRFPLAVSLGAGGGPERQTTITPLANGSEHRNRAHRHSRRRWDAGLGLKSPEDVQTLLAFWEARGGEWAGFRFRDPLDHSARRELLGVGDGERVRFPLRKSYGDGAGRYVRPLRFAEGVSVEPPTPFTVEPGAVVFETPPPPGAEVRASFEFDCLARFAASALDVRLAEWGAHRVASVPLVEILAHEVEDGIEDGISGGDEA